MPKVTVALNPDAYFRSLLFMSVALRAAAARVIFPSMIATSSGKKIG